MKRACDSGARARWSCGDMMVEVGRMMWTSGLLWCSSGGRLWLTYCFVLVFSRVVSAADVVVALVDSTCGF